MKAMHVHSNLYRSLPFPIQIEAGCLDRREKSQPGYDEAKFSKRPRDLTLSKSKSL